MNKTGLFTAVVLSTILFFGVVFLNSDNSPSIESYEEPNDLDSYRLTSQHETLEVVSNLRIRMFKIQNIERQEIPKLKGYGTSR